MLTVSNVERIGTNYNKNCHDERIIANAKSMPVLVCIPESDWGARNELVSQVVSNKEALDNNVK